jgi:hypothetical protein
MNSKVSGRKWWLIPMKQSAGTGDNMNIIQGTNTAPPDIRVYVSLTIFVALY